VVELFDWQTRIILIVFIISVAFFAVCYLLFGVVLLTAILLAIPAVVAIVALTSSFLKNATKVTPSIELKQQKANINDILCRDRWSLYDLVNWEFLKQKPHTNGITLDELHQLYGPEAIRHVKDVICFKAGNYGSTDVRLQRFYVEVNKALLPMLAEHKQRGGNSAQTYMTDRVRDSKQRGNDLYAPAAEFVNEFKNTHGGFGLHYSEKYFEGSTCLLKQQDYSGCKMWVDSILLAFYVFDHGYADAKQIRWICESRAGKLHKSKPVQFDVAQIISQSKWHEAN
jgi:hypothetical protein